MIRIVLLIVVLTFGECRSQDDRNSILARRLDSAIVGGTHEGDPGGSILVQMGDRIIYRRSFGLADLKTKERFSEQTVSNLGSITKTFVAYGILILRDRGKLSLDDPLIKYFPDFKNKSIAADVRIRHLLTHTSGLHDSRQVDRDSIFFLIANDEQNFAPIKQTDTLEFTPGSRWNYSNPAFNALALIIEKVSGMKWQRFIEQNIFRPAGMNDTRLTDGSYPSSGVAHGYRSVNGRYEEYDYGEYPTFCASGNGGAWSSIADLKKYYLAMKTATFISRESIEFSQTLWHPPNWSDTIPPVTGFSWFVTEKSEELPYKVVGHSGHQAGFVAFFDMFREKDLLILVELNSETDFDVSSIINILKETGYL